MLALVRGRLGLGEAFWIHAILGVAALNMACAFGRFMAIAEDWPSQLGLLFLLLPIPYGIAAVVGVWRSGRAAGNGFVADTAKILAVAWGFFFLAF